MDFFRMEKKNFILNEVGQSMVEYILLLAVLTSIGFGLFRSDAFKGVMGGDAEFFKKLRLQIAYSYRHGSTGTIDNSSYAGFHDSYYNVKENDTRFFGIGLEDEYPKN